MRSWLVGGLALFVALLSSPMAITEPPEPVTLRDVDGMERKLPTDAIAVYFFTSVECPTCQKYVERIRNLAADYANRGVHFHAIYPQALETRSEIADHAKAARYGFPALIDDEQRLSDRFRVASVPTTVVCNAAGEVVYRGPIDDNRTAQLAKKPYVRMALEGVLKGESAPIASVPVNGCPIQRRPVEKKDAPVTYANGIGKLLHESCANCHRPNQLAPFSLLTYDQARRWSHAIDQQVAARRMPPWKPANLGTFHGERHLAQADVDLVHRWVEAGAPQGDSARVPPPPVFKADWMLGQPDVVLTGETYDVGPKGDDEYRCFVLDPKLTEDRWVRAVEFSPGNPQIVHHVMTYIDTTGFAEKRLKEDGKPGFASRGTGPGFFPAGDLGGWGPGMQPTPLPDGMGRLLPKGAKIVMEVHYHKNGRDEQDQTKIGMHYAKQPVKQRVRSQVVLNMAFKLPPGAKRHEVKALWKVDDDLHAIAVIPHMHLIGKEILVQAKFPDGTEKALVHIKDWDFNWQESYVFKEPFALPTGTKVTVTGWFDNSDANPNNPNNPPRQVGFGEQTTDEMCVAYVAYVKDSEK